MPEEAGRSPLATVVLVPPGVFAVVVELVEEASAVLPPPACCPLGFSPPENDVPPQKARARVPIQMETIKSGLFMKTALNGLRVSKS